MTYARLVWNNFDVTMAWLTVSDATICACQVSDYTDGPNSKALTQYGEGSTSTTYYSNYAQHGTVLMDFADQP